MVAAEAGAAALLILPQDLAFVYLETTGGNPAHHRVTEVGIVRLAGGAVVEEWSSLVNPECRIPAYIEAFTGITNDMVAGAPRFADIAELVRGKLRSAVFVAHNARFDYSFLKAEFRRLGIPFSAQVMCTVKLSRRLFPEHPRHSLDAVMARHGLTCTARHRALGDARVLRDFWATLCGQTPVEILAAAVRAVTGANRLPAWLPSDLADELPEGPGAYRLFGEDDVLLYVGKSHSLRTRILGHFSTERGGEKEQAKARQTRRIDWVETAGELGAQLQEAEWIRLQKPLYNRRPKPRSDGCTLQGTDGAPGVQFRPIADIGGEWDRCYGVFQSQQDARRALVDIARAHSLCLKTLGLEEGEGSCLALHTGGCRGACIGREPLVLHDVRLKMALSALKLKSWPFPGRIALEEGRSEFHVLDHWAYLGTARSEEELAELAGRGTAGAFDADVYRMLVRYLSKNPKIRWREMRPPPAVQ